MLVATFDNRLAALDFYLERGDPREMEEFLRTGRGVAELRIDELQHAIARWRGQPVDALRP